MGAIELLRKRAPLLGGNFATWMGLFGAFQCLLVHFTHRDSHLNQVIAGACTGGLINIRGGWKYAMRGAISGGIFIGVFNIFEIIMTKKQLQAEHNMLHIEARRGYLEQLDQLRAYNPTLLTCTDEELYQMKLRLKQDMVDMQTSSLF